MNRFIEVNDQIRSKITQGKSELEISKNRTEQAISKFTSYNGALKEAIENLGFVFDEQKVEYDDYIMYSVRAKSPFPDPTNPDTIPNSTEDLKDVVLYVQGYYKTGYIFIGTYNFDDAVQEFMTRGTFKPNTHVEQVLIMDDSIIYELLYPSYEKMVEQLLN